MRVPVVVIVVAREVWTGLVAVILSVFFLLLLKIELEKDHPPPEPEGLRVVSGGNGVEVWWPGRALSGVKEAGFGSPLAGPSQPEDRTRRTGPS